MFPAAADEAARRAALDLLLLLCRLADFVVNKNREHDENPHGENGHPRDCFRDQSGKNRPPAAKHQKQEKRRAEVHGPLYGRNQLGPEGDDVGETRHAKREREASPRHSLRGNLGALDDYDGRLARGRKNHVIELV